MIITIMMIIMINSRILELVQLVPLHRSHVVRVGL